jgi:serine/threonine protein kinase/cytoskeletal protein RodZ
MVDRIGHYRIVAELGRGGMGIVYKAHEESLNRFVAIKVLGEHLTEDPGHVERFLREARSAASLNHPNIVQIYAVSEEEGRHFFAMEYVSGRSLQQILRSSGPLDPIQVAKIALQTASGLRAAHEQGIIHRDIKPANLLIDDRGLVKIADFGLALVTGGVSRLTATGMFMGTPGYLSPEQCLDQDPDHRTDIYSLGVTLYEALSGKVPFTADSPLALLRQIVEVEPPDLGDLKPDVDPELRTIVARMMIKDRNLRVSSCAELIGGLEKFLEARGAPGNLVERVAASAGSPPPPSPPPVPAAELDSQPTRQVSSDAIAAGATAVTAPAAETEVPVVETSPFEETPSGSGKRLALVAAVVVIFGLAAVVAAGVFAWRSGLFKAAMGGSEKAAVAEVETPLTDVETSPESAPETQSEVEELTEAAVTVMRSTGAEQAPESTTQPTTIDPDPARPEVTGQGTGDRQLTTSTAPPTEPRQEPAVPPPPVRPPPEGTVVIAVGETVLAGEAETVVENALSQAGIRLVDENGIPGIAAFLGTDLAPEPGEIHRLLRPFAEHLVLVRVEYLGERPLVYMGQQDVAFQARVIMVPIDLQAGNALAQPVRLRTEYTHLNAQKVAEKELRRPAYRIGQLLAAK